MKLLVSTCPLGENCKYNGGNKKLVKLVDEKGFDYVKQNFQYSILENYNAKIDDKVVLKRESWWKETLQSRRFGYNSKQGPYGECRVFKWNEGFTRSIPFVPTEQ